MADIRFNCPSCNQSMEAPSDMSGQVVACPSCRSTFKIPFVGSMKKCPYCGELVLRSAVICKHCRTDFRAAAMQSNKKKADPVTVTFSICAALAFCIAFVGFFHIITGEGVGFKIVLRNSFGLSEFFINADSISGMPAIAAKARYPIGCAILQREKILESDEAREKRIEQEVKDKMRSYGIEY